MNLDQLSYKYIEKRNNNVDLVLELLKTLVKQDQFEVYGNAR